MKDNFSLGLLVLLGCMLLPVAIVAEGQDDFIREGYIRKALRSLDSDSPDAKVNAIIYLSTSGQARFLRPLGRELLENLDKDSGTLYSGPHDPYIKSLLARGMGRFGQPEALYFLGVALKKTSEIMDDQRSKALAQRDRERKFIEEGKAPAGKDAPAERSINEKPIPKLVLEPNQPGPALMRSGHSMPFSPDVHWSVSDEFKDAVVDVNDPTHRMRLIGYNYVNVAVAVLDGYAETFARIGDKLRADYGPKHVEELKKFLAHDFPAVRSASARALGQLGTPVALAALQERLGGEKDGVVKVNICRGVLSADKTRIECYKQLVELLRSPDTEQRYAAAVALRDISFGESLAELRRALRFEENAELRLVLRQAIDRALVDSLQSPSEG